MGERSNIIQIYLLCSRPLFLSPALSLFTFYIFVDSPLECSFNVFLETIYDVALTIHGEISVSAIIVKGNDSRLLSKFCVCVCMRTCGYGCGCVMKKVMNA